ncbi:MAG: Nif11-like leader peptide family RiPP precursor [Cyanobacteria bacterium]|nr:Nif11-like leader peptide family RiPP precursor [Cyanobacteriota bacterium]
MSEDQLKAFLLRLIENRDLLDKLKDSADLGNLSKLAQEAGINLDPDDLLRCQQEYLTDDELELFAGGGCMNPMTQLPPTPGPTQWVDIGHGNYIYKRC